MQQNCIQFISSRGTKNPKKIHVIKPDLDFVLHFVLNGGEKNVGMGCVSSYLLLGSFKNLVGR